MDDRFLKDAWRAPRPEFEDGLRAKLARDSAEGAEDTEGAAGAPVRRAHAPRWWRAAVPAAAGIALVALFTVPGVRAAASAFLDLFRVRTFTAIAIDPARLERLDRASVDLKTILGGQVTQQTESGPPRFYTDLGQAAAAAGIPALAPGWLPKGWAADTIAVRGESRAQVIVDTRKIDEALHRLELDDVTLPAGLDGARVEIHQPPAVVQQFRAGEHRLMLLQAASPEVGLPQGVDLARLGEVALRVLGMDASEAHRFAQTIDWHGTVLVPLPTDATSFREVDVRGHRALLVTSAAQAGGRPAADDGRRRHRFDRGVMLLWSEGDRVYAVQGGMDPENVLQLANALR